MEIINLHIRCNKKARKTLRPKKVSEPGLDDSAIEEEQKWSSDEKNSATKTGKIVKKTLQSKKAPKSPMNLLIQVKKKKKSHPRMIKVLLYWG